MAAGDTTRFTTTVMDWALVADLLVRQLVPRAQATPGEALGPAEQRLLEAPAYSAAEVRYRGEDPDQPQLIRLVREDSGVQLPAFQCDASGRAIPVVLAANPTTGRRRGPLGRRRLVARR